jgi:copper chaperone
MSAEVGHDHLLLLKVEGMHCHRCEDRIRRSLVLIAGVNEVEVDFASGQASVLFDPAKSSPASLAAAVQTAGYNVTASSVLPAPPPPTPPTPPATPADRKHP